ncbi:MAG: hypothetical protein M0Z43_00735 [Acidithiobacillus sp.]|nr:hypothetical protein [Acidithiobacillus sp.]
MKIACVTTTINIPTVLALYAKHGPDVMFFVIGDRKTPDMEVVNFLTDHVPNHVYYGIDTQHKLGWKCSQLIGESCIQRRNIGFLEALNWGADVVVSVDDDNISLDRFYFNRMGVLLESVPFDGAQASSTSGWFDVGQLLSPKSPHRGFPHTKKAEPVFKPVVAAKVGVAAGVCLGDPDISAAERIANGPTVHSVSELLCSGIVVDPQETWTVWNSQNTAVIRELIPAWFMIPFVGRADDIFASLIVQRAMRQTGHVTHFGRPFVFQQRNAHDLIKDLEQETWGARHILEFAYYLEGIENRASVVELVRAIYIHHFLRFPEESIAAALAFCEDCERALQ